MESSVELVKRKNSQSRSVASDKSSSSSRRGLHGNAGIVLEFKNISYKVQKNVGGYFWKKKIEEKVILKNISGLIQPGDLVALMGASGAGKSSLLNVLSRRIRVNTGEICVNGIPLDKTDVIHKSSCFIQQEDFFYGFITVEEHLNHQANFRIPSVDKALKKAKVNEVMDTFSLNKSRHSKIGNVEQGAGRGISGGEKKRLQVASELLTNPLLIFADEPTSGLDSMMAEYVCDVLKKIAKSGRTVICTIHQPNSDVFTMFNKMLLLSEGEVVYMGPRPAALPYFNLCGIVCPPYTNPADFFIDICSIDWDNPSKKLEELQKLCENWNKNSEAFLHEWETTLKYKIDEETTKRELAEQQQDQQLLTACTIGTVGETNLSSTIIKKTDFNDESDKNETPPRVKTRVIFKTLLERNILAAARNPSIVRARLIQAIITAVLAGCVYFRLGSGAAYSKAGACFFIMINQGFMSAYAALTALMGEKKIILREYKSGLYPLAAYYFSKIITDVLFQFYLPLVYTSIAWYMIGLNDQFTRFLTGLSYVFLLSIAVASIGYIIGSFAPNMGVAIALAPVVLLPCLLVSGFVIAKASLPKFWLWLYYLSPFVYSFSGVMRATFLNTSIPPPQEPSSSIQLFSSGNQVLETFGIATNSYRWFIDLAVLLGWIFIGRLVGLFLFILTNR